MTAPERRDRRRHKGDGTIRLNDLTVMPGSEALLRTHCLDSLNALFATLDGERLDKPGLDRWRERLRVTIPDGDGTHVFYLKRFHRPPRRAQRVVRRAGCGANSLAGLEWAWMRRIAGGGIACVRPVAFGEELRGRSERRSAILTEAVPGDALERWVARWTVADRERITRLIRPLARLIARFHEKGYIHRDLYLSHVFHDVEARPDQSLCLIDLQRIIRPIWWRNRWIVKDLASLNYSTPSCLIHRTDRLRWLKHYLGLSKLTPEAKQLAYRVVGKTQQIARHDRRRTAALSTSSSAK